MARNTVPIFKKRRKEGSAMIPGTLVRAGSVGAAPTAAPAPGSRKMLIKVHKSKEGAPGAKLLPPPSGSKTMGNKSSLTAVQEPSKTSSSSSSGSTGAATAPPVKSDGRETVQQEDTRPTYFLFVDRLPYGKDTPDIEKDLRELMRNLGTLRKLYRKKKAGIGYITFRSRRSLGDLVKAMQNLKYEGRVLRIEPAKEEVAKKSVVDKSESTRQVFLKNLPHDMTKDILKAFIQDTAAVDVKWVKLIQKSSAAFITLGSEEEAKTCVEILNGYRLLKNKVVAEHARPPPEKVPQVKQNVTSFEHADVLIGPISSTVTETHLQSVISGAGCNVTKVKLLFNPHTGKFKECARVQLGDAISAQQMYNTFDGKMLFGRQVNVEAYLGFDDEEEDEDEGEDTSPQRHQEEPEPQAKRKRFDSIRAMKKPRK